MSFGSAETGRKDVFLKDGEQRPETYGNLSKKRSQTCLVPRSHTDLEDPLAYEKIVPITADDSLGSDTNKLPQFSR